MDASTRREINNIKWELQSIIDELDSISSGILTDFTNIGNERCSKAVAKAADQYRIVKRKLNNL